MADLLQRPRSLAEVVRMSGADYDIDSALREFLDEYYCAPGAAARAQMLAEAPALTGHAKADAYLAAVAEHLSRWAGCPKPAWVEAPERFLRRPSFPLGMESPTESFRALCIAQSPVAFRRRLIFVDADPLYRPRRDVQGYTVEPLCTPATRPAGST
jgi:hypothetical protein